MALSRAIPQQQQKHRRGLIEEEWVLRRHVFHITLRILYVG
jgi:hypothetical protein